MMETRWELVRIFVNDSYNKLYTFHVLPECRSPS